MHHKTPNVLIMVRDTLVGGVIEHRVRLMGWEAICFTSQDELDLLLAAGLPQLFVVDLDDTGTMGLSLVERLTTDERTSRVTIMCISADGDLNLAELAFRTGAKDFLLVPFDILLLQQKVEKWLDRVNATQKPDHVQKEATELVAAAI